MSCINTLDGGKNFSPGSLTNAKVGTIKKSVTKKTCHHNLRLFCSFNIADNNFFAKFLFISGRTQDVVVKGGFVGVNVKNSSPCGLVETRIGVMRKTAKIINSTGQAVYSFTISGNFEIIDMRSSAPVSTYYSLVMAFRKNSKEVAKDQHVR